MKPIGLTICNSSSTSNLPIQHRSCVNYVTSCIELRGCRYTIKGVQSNIELIPLSIFKIRGSDGTIHIYSNLIIPYNTTYIFKLYRNMIQSITSQYSDVAIYNTLTTK